MIIVSCLGAKWGTYGGLQRPKVFAPAPSPRMQRAVGKYHGGGFVWEVIMLHRVGQGFYLAPSTCHAGLTSLKHLGTNQICDVI